MDKILLPAKQMEHGVNFLRANQPMVGSLIDQIIFMYISMQIFLVTLFTLSFKYCYLNPAVPSITKYISGLIYLHC